MNWMGGARSRIRQKEEKRKQDEFFARMRLAKQLNGQTPTAFTPASIYFQSKEFALNTKPITTTNSTYSTFQPQNMNRHRPGSQSKPSSILFSSSSGCPNQGLDDRSNRQQRYKSNLKNRSRAVTMPAICNAPVSNLDQWCHEVHNQREDKLLNYTVKNQSHAYEVQEEPEASQYLLEDFQINSSKLSNDSGEDSPFLFKPNMNSTNRTLERKIPIFDREALSRDFSFHDRQASQREKPYISPKSQQLKCTANSDFYSPKSSDSEMLHEDDPKVNYEEQRSFSHSCNKTGSFSYLTPSSSSSSKCTLPGLLVNEENVFTSPVAFNFERNNEEPLKRVSTPTWRVSTSSRRSFTPNWQGSTSSRRSFTPNWQGSTPIKPISTPPRRGLTLSWQGSTPIKPISTPPRRVFTAARRVSTPSRRGSTPLKPVSTTPRRGSTPLKPVSTPTRRGSTPIKPVSTPSRRGSTPLKPVSTPTRQGSTPIKPISTPPRWVFTAARRGSTPLKPVSTTPRRGSTPIKPVSTPSRRCSTPLKPVSTPTRRGSTPIKPVSTPTRWGSTPLKPVSCAPRRDNTPPKRVSSSVTIVESPQREKNIPQNEITKHKETEALNGVSCFPTEQYWVWLWKEIQDQLFFQAKNISKPDGKMELSLSESFSSTNIQNARQTKEVDAQTDQIETQIPVIIDKGIQVDSEDLRLNFLLNQKLWYSV